MPWVGILIIGLFIGHFSFDVTVPTSGRNKSLITKCKVFGQNSLASYVTSVPGTLIPTCPISQKTIMNARVS